MMYDPAKHHRRSIRLRGYDYAQIGWYFVTVCTQDHVCGIDSTTYLTNCFAELSGVTVYHVGDCPI